MSCYLCGSEEYKTRKGIVRDSPHIRILECEGCGLVYLDSFEHIVPDFYTNSRMVGAEFPSVDYWLKVTAVDDERRFKMFSSLLPNKRVMDFGCGGGGLKYGQQSCLNGCWC